MKKIAVLLTCFNRKEKTLHCLESLRCAVQKVEANYLVSIFLVDDGSTDGTGEAVLDSFPEVSLIHGTGDLFWAGGMRLAWNNALKDQADYYLLLNDDTFLFEDAIENLMRSCEHFRSSNKKNEAIFVGSTVDEVTGDISYGGRKLFSKNSPKSYLVNNETDLSECDLGNGNIMLVPSEIVKQIGILSSKYTHAIADHDYTLRAKKAGFKVFVVPGISGTCNTSGNNRIPDHYSLSQRINYLYSPKGISYKEYLYFIKSQFPLHFPQALIKLWMKTLFPVWYEKLKKQ